MGMTTAALSQGVCEEYVRKAGGVSISWQGAGLRMCTEAQSRPEGHNSSSVSVTHPRLGHGSLYLIVGVGRAGGLEGKHVKAPRRVASKGGCSIRDILCPYLPLAYDGIFVRCAVRTQCIPGPRIFTRTGGPVLGLELGDGLGCE